MFIASLRSDLKVRKKANYNLHTCDLWSNFWHAEKNARRKKKSDDYLHGELRVDFWCDKE